MKFVLSPLTDQPPLIRAAPSKRDWMDATPQSFAYRCLPLTIANAHGWEILSARSFTATWDGTTRTQGIEIAFDEDDPEPAGAVVGPLSHFGSGVLTFEMPFLFRTPPGWNVMVMGPVNRPKDGIAALTGVIETDWSPYSFTMNWLFTRADHPVRFERGEPICHLFPLKRAALERVEPELRDFHEDRDRAEQNRIWSESRGAFITALSEREAEAVKEKWQKAYYRGDRPDGRPGSKDHQIKLRLEEFRPAGLAAQHWEGEGVEMKRKPEV